ncbi:MAG: MFS transporter [Candidatus Omnitrophota bacterium]
MAQFSKILKNRNFFCLWLSQIISQFGDRLNQMALIGLIYHRAPGSTLELAKLMTFTIVPVFLIGPAAGVYVDRWDRRRTMFICDFLKCLLVILIPLLFINCSSLLPVYIIVFLVFSLSRFYVPAKMSIIPDLVKPEDLLLANSLANTTGMIAAVLGFGLGGLIVAAAGVRYGFYINALTFFFSAFLIFLITKPVVIKREAIIEVGKEVIEVIRKSVVTEFKEGLRYLLNHRQIRSTVNMLFVLWLALGAVYVIVIVFVQESLHTVTEGLGFLAMFLGMGLFLGALAYGRFGPRGKQFKVIFTSLIASGIMLAAFALLVHTIGSFLLAALLSLALGFTVSPIMTAANTLVHEASSAKMRGKVFSNFEIIMHLAFLLAMLGSAALAERCSRLCILVGVGMVLVGVGIWGFVTEKKNYGKAA